MLVYLTPLDAVIDITSRNRSGGDLLACPFEAVNPRPYITEHEDWFNVYVGYGFAARGKHLVVGARGDVRALTIGMHFRIMPYEFEYIYIKFSDAVIDKINTAHRATNMHDYEGVIDELAERIVQIRAAGAGGNSAHQAACDRRRNRHQRHALCPVRLGRARMALRGARRYGGLTSPMWTSARENRKVPTKAW